MADPLITFYNSLLVQKALYWNQDTTEFSLDSDPSSFSKLNVNQYGEFTFVPSIINVRWDTEIKLMVDTEGNNVMSSATVMVDDVIGDSILVGDYLELLPSDSAQLRLIEDDFENFENDLEHNQDYTDPRNRPNAYRISEVSQTYLFQDSVNKVTEVVL